jgi:hypothetical protein
MECGSGRASLGTKSPVWSLGLLWRADADLLGLGSREYSLRLPLRGLARPDRRVGQSVGKQWPRKAWGCAQLWVSVGSETATAGRPARVRRARCAVGGRANDPESPKAPIVPQASLCVGSRLWVKGGGRRCGERVSLAPESRPTASSIDHLFRANSGHPRIAVTADRCP